MAAKYFSNKGVKTNVTLVFSAGQALLAAKQALLMLVRL
jgi:transaldolase